jgi:O-antigen/teichoic acid export membrane protein
VVLVLPLVLRKFSPAEVVVWQLFATLATLLLLLDFGLAPTFSRLLAYAKGGASIEDLSHMKKVAPRAQSQVNHDTLRSVYGTLHWLYLRCGLVATALLCVGGTVALLKPMSALAHPGDAWLAWGVVALTSLAAVWGQVFGSALQGLNQIAVMRRWEILTSAGQIACSFLVLMLDGGLLALVISNQAWLMFNALRLRRLLYRTHPELQHAPNKPLPEVMHTLWPAAWRSGIGMLMSNGVIQLSGVMYSQIAPATEVAAYLLALRIMTVVTQFSSAPYYSKLPRLAELHAAGQRDTQLQLAQRGMGLSLWVYVAGAIAVMWGLPLALTFTGSQVAFVSEPFWCLMALAFLVERLGAMHIQLYSLTNHIVWHIANGVTGVLLIVLAVVFYRWLGAIGLPLAMLVVNLGFYGPYAIHYSSRAFGFGIFSFLNKTSLGPLALLSGMSALAIHWFHG